MVEGSDLVTVARSIGGHSSGAATIPSSQTEPAAASSSSSAGWGEGRPQQLAGIAAFQLAAGGIGIGIEQAGGPAGGEGRGSQPRPPPFIYSRTPYRFGKQRPGLPNQSSISPTPARSSGHSVLPLIPWPPGVPARRLESI
jgi:hypothetical protein